MGSQENQTPIQENRVYVLLWFQRDGPVTDPYGFSGHMTEGDAQAFVREYWSKQPTRAPETFDYSEGLPYLALVSDETFEEIKASKNGVRYGGKPPTPYKKPKKDDALATKIIVGMVVTVDEEDVQIGKGIYDYPHGTVKGVQGDLVDLEFAIPNRPSVCKSCGSSYSLSVLGNTGEVECLASGCGHNHGTRLVTMTFPIDMLKPYEGSR